MEEYNLNDIVIIHNDTDTNEFYTTFPNADCGLSLQEIIDKDIGIGSTYIIMNKTDLPTDYTYFSAWTYNEESNQLGIDISKAKEEQKDNIRELRKPLLEKEDIIFMKSLENGDTAEQQASVARKQVLRDMTNKVTDLSISGPSIDEISSEIEETWDKDLLGEDVFKFKKIYQADGSVQVEKYRKSLS